MTSRSPKVWAYAVAAVLLRRPRSLLEQQGRVDEWRRYIVELRQANARKRRLVEMLDGLAH